MAPPQEHSNPERPHRKRRRPSTRTFNSYDERIGLAVMSAVICLAIAMLVQLFK